MTKIKVNLLSFIFLLGLFSFQSKTDGFYEQRSESGTNSVIKRFYDGGILESETQVNFDGSMNSRAYSSAGNPIVESYYDSNGGGWKVWFGKDGKSGWKETFEKSKFHRIFYQNGKIRTETIYTNSKKNEFIYRAYYPNGKLSLQEHHKGPELIGTITTFYSSGLPREVMLCEGGVVSSVKYYSENGKIVSDKKTYEFKEQEDEFEVQKKTGVLVSYTKAGYRKLKKYKNGILIKESSYGKDGKLLNEKII